MNLSRALLLLIGTVSVPTCTSFAPSSFSRNIIHSALFSEADALDELIVDGVSAESSVLRGVAKGAPTTPSETTSSNGDVFIDNDDGKPKPTPQKASLKSLLPTPASRPLKMDKFGRRVFRMEDDTTVKLTKGSGDASPEETKNNSGTSPILSSLTEDSKEISGNLAAETSFQVEKSSDLKSLLPKQKMTWMTLDKFGRRVQRMQDDGTINMMKEPLMKSDSAVDVSSNTDERVDTSPVLSSLLENSKEIAGDLAAEANFQVKRSGDLKTLLPNKKMAWRELDKYGRRVQKMNDESPLNRGAATKSESDVDVMDGGGNGVSLSELLREESTVDLGNSRGRRVGQSLSQFVSGKEDRTDIENNRGTSINLKDLAGTSKKPKWAKLDFKGGIVEDDRRVKKDDVSKTTNGDDNKGASINLKDLAATSKKGTWTRLDFKGGVVEDERRTKRDNATKSADGDGSKGGYTNLKTLLPERKIVWRDRDQKGSKP